jgi:DNA-binding NarL/FixJ family response regulator
MTKANARNPFGLTHRQCEVMEALTRHGDSKLVARELDVDSKTIDWTIREAVKRMGARNRIQAVVRFDRAVNPRTVFRGERPANSVFDLASNEERRAA